MHAISNGSSSEDFLYFSMLHLVHRRGQLPDEHVLWEMLLWFESRCAGRCVRAVRGASRQWRLRLLTGWCCKCREVKQGGAFDTGWQYALNVDSQLARRAGVYVSRLMPPCARIHRAHCYCIECRLGTGRGVGVAGA